MSDMQRLGEGLEARGVEFVTDLYNTGMQLSWFGSAGVEWRARVLGGRLVLESRDYVTPEQAILATLPRTATRLSVCCGAVGHCECSRCHGRVGMADKYCKHCGSMLTKTEYEVM